MSRHLVGDSVFAPEGCAFFDRATTTYFLRNDAVRGRVLLVEFLVRTKSDSPAAGRPWKEGTRIRAVLHNIARDKYEASLVSGELVSVARSTRAPHWLDDSGSDSSKQGFVLKRMRTKLECLEAAICNIRHVIASDDPEAMLNRLARDCSPKQNETRFRTDFFLWACFGEDGLRYRGQAIGHWSRNQSPEYRKLGRPSLSRGKNAGHNVASIAGAIVRAYAKRAKLAVPMTRIYADAMREDFGCKAVIAQHGFMRYVHPAGEPFPTFAQFRYHVVRALGLEKVQVTKLGRRLMRHKKTPSKGSFNETIVNALQHVEMDANFVHERPKSLVAGAVHPRLIVARAIDLASGIDTGIGFSLDGEKASAYQMARFCQAVDKVWFCSLFGLEIEHWQWPSIGVPLKEVVDRGPGADRAAGADAWDDDSKSPIRSITPTRQPRSKPTVEATHRRQSRNEELTRVRESTSSAYELVRREILRTLATNETRDVSSRIPFDLEAVVHRPCPNALYAALIERGRVEGGNLPTHQAIRKFLKPILVTIESDAAWLHGQRYFSAELANSKLLKRLHRERATPIGGFALDACVRFIWAEVDGKLAQLELKPMSPVDVDLRNVSEADLVAFKQLRAARASEFREHQSAVATEARAMYRGVTGKGWDSLNSQRPRSASGRRNAALHRSMSDAFHNREEGK